MYRRWPDELGPNIEMLAVQLPGREARTREPPLERIDDIVYALTKVLRPLVGDAPVAFLGHSMGGLVAFELARALSASCHVAHLFVSACLPPRMPRRDSPIHKLPDPELVRELRELGGTPDEILGHQESLELFLPLLRSDLAAHETYAYRIGAPISCPIAAFGGLHDRTTDPRVLPAWADETTGPFRLTLIPGDHFFITSHRSALIATINSELERFR